MPVHDGRLDGRAVARRTPGASPVAVTAPAGAGRSVIEAQRLVGNRAVSMVLGAAPAVSVQRAPAPSGAAPVEGAVRPTVSAARALLGRAQELACAAPPDYASADIILAGLQEWLDEDANRTRRDDVFRSLGFAKQTAMMATGHSIDAIVSLRRRVALDRKYSPAEPMRTTWWTYHRTEFDVGAEFLEVLTGERTLDQTVAPAISQGALSTIEMYISSIPGVGSLVAIGEAIVGRSLFGRKLSGTERAVLGALGVLSELGVLVRSVRAVTDAVRLRILATANVAILRNIGLPQAVRLVAGARVLTGPEKAWLKRFAQVIKGGGRLAPDDIVEAHRILGKMNEGALVAGARTRNAQQLATGTGVLIDAGATATEAERRVAEILMKHFGVKKILVLTTEASKKGAAAGQRTPDFLIGSVLADTYRPTSGSVKHILQEIGRKHSQAGVIAVDLIKSSVDTATLRREMARFWGRPQSIDIRRVLIIEGEAVTADLARPAAFGPPQGLSAAGSAGRAGAAGAGAEPSRTDQPSPSR